MREISPSIGLTLQPLSYCMERCVIVCVRKMENKDGVRGEEAANHVWKYGLFFFFFLADADYDLRKH